MEDSTDDKWIFEVSFILDILILSLLALVETALFVKLKFKIDISGMFLLILNLTVAILRIFKGEQDQKTYFNIINVSCQLLIWFALYYFILDLKIVKETLCSTTLLEYKIKMRRAKWEKIVICCFLLIYTSFTIYWIAMKGSG